MFSCQSEKPKAKINPQLDKQEILQTIENWNTGWDSKDVELAIKDYSDETDWTNAFGDRMKSKEELRALLEEIFAMDFVMTGKQNYIENEVEFIKDDIALVRSKNLRKNQEWSDGSQMGDRDINHLRVYQKFNGEWKIINHMISQAQEKK